jgi:hypothetical protein
MDTDVIALNDDELDLIFGGGSFGEALLIGAAAGGFVGSLAGGPPGAAAGALIGGAVAAGLYYL